MDDIVARGRSSHRNQRQAQGRSRVRFVRLASHLLRTPHQSSSPSRYGRLPMHRGHLPAVASALLTATGAVPVARRDGAGVTGFVRLQQSEGRASGGRFSGEGATRGSRAASADVVSGTNRRSSEDAWHAPSPIPSYRHSSSTADQRRGGRGPRSCLGTRRPPRAGRHRSARPGARRPSVSPGARAPASGCMTITNLAANSAAGRRAPATATAWARTRRSASTGEQLRLPSELTAPTGRPVTSALRRVVLARRVTPGKRRRRGGRSGRLQVARRGSRSVPSWPLSLRDRRAVALPRRPRRIRARNRRRHDRLVDGPEVERFRFRSSAEYCLPSPGSGLDRPTSVGRSFGRGGCFKVGMTSGQGVD